MLVSPSYNNYQESSGVMEVHWMAMITTLDRGAASVSETEDRHRLVKKLNEKRCTSSCYNYIIILPLFIYLVLPADCTS